MTPEQSKVLAELEADGKLHLSLVYRGDAASAGQFIEAQKQVLEELYAPEKEEGEITQETEQTESSKKKQMRPLWKKPRKVGWNKP